MNSIYYLNPNGAGTPNYIAVAGNKARAFELIQIIWKSRYCDEIVGGYMTPNSENDLIDLEILTESAERAIEV